MGDEMRLRLTLRDGEYVILREEDDVVLAGAPTPQPQGHRVSLVDLQRAIRDAGDRADDLLICFTGMFEREVTIRVSSIDRVEEGPPWPVS